MTLFTDSLGKQKLRSCYRLSCGVLIAVGLLCGCGTSRAGAPSATLTAQPASTTATGNNATSAALAAPAVSQIGGHNVLVTTPELPTGVKSLSLQKKLADEKDSAYKTVASKLPGKAGIAVTGLKEGTAYTFRYLPQGAGAMLPSAEAKATTEFLPKAPAAPIVNLVAGRNISVLTPELPEHAKSLTLQKKLADEKDNAFKDVATKLPGKTGMAVTGLKESTAYSLRFVAEGPGGGAPGEAVKVTTNAPGEAPKIVKPEISKATPAKDGVASASPKAVAAAPADKPKAP